MDESFEDAVRAACGTELDRLSGDKVLLAATDATLERAAVLGALRRSFGRAAAQSDAWATSAEEPVGSVLAEAADGLSAAGVALAEDVTEPAEGEADVAEDTASAPPDGPTVLTLGDPQVPFARAGACCVAAPLLLDGLALHGVSFFVNEADTARADRCRAARQAVGEIGEKTTAQLADACADEGDRTAVVDGAVTAVEASYATYVEILGGMGLDPKPIC
jgi:hypothetical protein